MLPMPNEVIERVHTLAQHAHAAKGVTFADHNRDTMINNDDDEDWTPDDTSQTLRDQDPYHNNYYATIAGVDDNLEFDMGENIDADDSENDDVNDPHDYGNDPDIADHDAVAELIQHDNFNPEFAQQTEPDIVPNEEVAQQPEPDDVLSKQVTHHAPMVETADESNVGNEEEEVEGDQEEKIETDSQEESEEDTSVSNNDEHHEDHINQPNIDEIMDKRYSTRTSQYNLRARRTRD